MRRWPLVSVRRMSVRRRSSGRSTPRRNPSQASAVVPMDSLVGPPLALAAASRRWVNQARSTGPCDRRHAAMARSTDRTTAAPRTIVATRCATNHTAQAACTWKRRSIRKPLPQSGRSRRAAPGEGIAAPLGISPHSSSPRGSFPPSNFPPSSSPLGSSSLGSSSLGSSARACCFSGPGDEPASVGDAAPSPSALARLDLSRVAGEVFRDDAPISCDLARAA